MVIFDAAVAGTSAEAWAASDRLASLPALELESVDHLVVVAAHPDDETLGLGGLMHRLERAGTAVHLVVATDGAASHPRSPTITPDALVERRVRETDAALARLAENATVHRLGIPDGGVREHRDALRAGLAAVVDALGGGVLIASTWRGDGHRDHRVVGEVCAELCATAGLPLLEYPVWMWHWAVPDSPEVPWDLLRRVELTEHDHRVKRAAIAEYESQIAPLSPAAGDEAVLGEDVLEHFRRGTEVVVLSDSRRDYFERLYARHDDPWGYDSRWYERRKRDLTMGVLRRERYGRTLELGCATGALTGRLAERCDSVIGMDATPAALEHARRRLAGLEHVELLEADVRDGIPPGRFDLVVLSELGYYLEAGELRELLAAVARSLTDRGELLACHWRHPARSFRQTAADVHAAVEALGLHRQVRHEEPDLLVELYSVDANSVARLEGLA